MANLNDIFGWFGIGKRPTAQQFRDTFSSFWHRSERIPISQIFGLKEEIDRVTTNFKGYKSTINKLLVDLPKPKNDWYAYVGETNTIWEVSGGQWVDSGKPIPEDLTNLSEYVSKDLLSKSTNGIHNQLYTTISHNNQTRVSICGDGIDTFEVLGEASRSIVVRKNGVALAQINNDEILGSVSSLLKNGVVHILANNMYKTANNNKVSYYTYDIVTNTLELKFNLTFGVDTKEAFSLIDFKGGVYTAVSYVNTDNVVDQSKAIIDLYKINDTSFEFVSAIATPNDLWGYEFTTGDTTYNSFPRNGAVRGRLSTDGTDLYCTYIGIVRGSAGNSPRSVYVKKSNDLQDWIQVGINSKIKAYSSVVMHHKGKMFYLSSAYISHLSEFEKMEVVFSYGDRYSTGYYNLIPYMEEQAKGKIVNPYYNVCELDNDILVIMSGRLGDGSFAYYSFTVSKDRILSTLNGEYIRDRGILDTIPENLNIGDSFIYNVQGVSNIPIYTYPYLYSTATEYLHIGKDEKVRVVWNGSKLGWMIQQIQNAASRKDTFPFTYNAHLNPFIAYGFRIPVVVESADSNVLIASSDVRYTRGEDFDIIEVGVCRSFDNGLTWQDHTIALHRDDNADYSNRIHDASMCVDTNPKSPHYGRIWIIAKMWLNDVYPSYWTDRQIKLYISYSDDNGLTWSEQQDISNIFPAEYMYFSAGCQKGRTLKDGTLILPVYVGKVDTNKKEFTTYSSFIYSTDNGSAWNLGDVAPDVSNENNIIEELDGSLLMNARKGNLIADYRAVYRLSSIGSGWVYQPELSEIPFMMSANVNESLERLDDWYYYSKPMPDASNPMRRQNTTLFKSKDLINWIEVERLLKEGKGTGGYSSILLSRTRFGVIYEIENYRSCAYANLDYLL